MTTPFGDLRVILVDSDPSGRTAVREMLGSLGVGHVVTLPDGSAALALLGEPINYNLIICDLGSSDLATPHRDGNDFIWHVRLTDADVPIVALKGGDTMGDRSALMSGADAVLHAPISRLSLEATLHDLLEAKRAYYERSQPYAGAAAAAPPDPPDGPDGAPSEERTRPPPRDDAPTPASMPASAPATDHRFTAIRRRFARRYHPDGGVMSELERSRRSRIFKEFWPEFEHVERGVGMPGRRSR